MNEQIVLVIMMLCRKLPNISILLDKITILWSIERRNTLGQKTHRNIFMEASSSANSMSSSPVSGAWNLKQRSTPATTIDSSYLYTSPFNISVHHLDQDLI